MRKAALTSLARLLEARGRSIDLGRKAAINVACGNLKGSEDEVTRHLHVEYGNSKGDEKDKVTRDFHVEYDNSKGDEKVTSHSHRLSWIRVIEANIERQCLLCSECL